MKTKKSPIRSGIFGPESNFDDRYIKNSETLKKLVSHLKGLGLKIVLTQGTFDMVHPGHARYLEKAKEHGDFLIVGVDSDEKVRYRKGPERPLIPQAERMEMVCHLRAVDVVFLKEKGAPKWSLTKLVEPDVLIAVEGTYDEKQIKSLEEYCGKVVVLKRQAETSTSAKIRLFQINLAKKFKSILTPKVVSVIEETFKEIMEKSK